MKCTIKGCGNDCHNGFLMCLEHGYELINKAIRSEKRREKARAKRKECERIRAK